MSIPTIISARVVTEKNFLKGDKKESRDYLMEDGECPCCDKIIPFEEELCEDCKEWLFEQEGAGGKT